MCMFVICQPLHVASKFSVLLTHRFRALHPLGGLCGRLERVRGRFVLVRILVLVAIGWPGRRSRPPRGTER